MINKTLPSTTYLKDYKKPDYLIEQVHIRFELFEDKTIVTTVMQIIPNTEMTTSPLILNGHKLELKELVLDGKEVSKENFIVSDHFLHLYKVPNKKFCLQI